jgi:murein L,D-transpeptidase YcbB/YkuD
MKHNSLLTLILILTLLYSIFSLEASASSDSPQDSCQIAIGDVLNSSPATTLGFNDLQTDPAEINQVIEKIYVNNQLHPYWVDNNGPGQKAETLLAVLASSDEDGLAPEHYRLEQINSLWDSYTPADLAALDVTLTLALGTYVTDMREGRSVTCLLDPKLFAAARDKEVKIAEVVQEALDAPELGKFLKQQAPQHHGYQSLKRALALYRKFEKQGGWEKIPAGQILKPGMTDSRLALITRRLAITRDLLPLAEAPTWYNKQLVQAIKHFQGRYNLGQDGIIGKATLAAMNIPVEDHIRRIILNMERWRWLPHTLDGQRLLVNIAGFRLAAIQNEEQEITMPVIVGKVYHKTPVFSHTMRYLEINPYWNIPNSIAINEIVPKMIKNPGYLAKKHIRIFAGWQNNAPEVDPASIDWHTIGNGIKRYRLRQDPGAHNALGTIKFMFPNRYNVYLHDTPGHSLFKRNNRSFSHGCIRVSDPQGLAEYILNKDGKPWTRKKINALISKGKRLVIPLKHPFPVHILYRTVFIDPNDGAVHFYDDIYGRDNLLAQALFTKGQPAQCRYNFH